MTGSTLLSATLGLTLLVLSVVLPGSHTTEQSAREQASEVVRAKLRSTASFKPNQFLSVRRDEELEASLATVTVGWPSGPIFIYKLSPVGVEIKESAVVNHIMTDWDPMFIVAVPSADGNAYRIHGFGLQESTNEFQRFVAALKIRINSSEQAEALADFYRAVNPENRDGLTPISSLLALKQAAERQCVGSSSFDSDEKVFAVWWKRAKSLYSGSPFTQTASSTAGGYQVEWTVLSASAKGNCGGAPLRVRLHVDSDGRMGEPTFSTFQESGSSTQP